MTPDKESRPAGDRAAEEAPATGLNTIVDADGVARRCPQWATSSTVSRLLEDQVAEGLPISAGDLDVIVNTDCVDDR